MRFINVYFVALLVYLCHGRSCPSTDPKCREAAMEKACRRPCRKQQVMSEDTCVTLCKDPLNPRIQKLLS
ncbi:unnamed protein product [Cylicocyclus nassatus]|uniref:Uncharacterized protein n=1 Tax=Cylicocyclus nassatus TaxID=53992 RepID=A0AA36DTY9_CYLNA|nr:unnamed protein product [Cylicocyclus nassatus]